ncbi:MAG: hypothetical protein HOE35_04880 [Candidatus Ruthia sp.]|jgi:hypothetical protein|nr:hypothetical protein [Candidatus Ruthturnera sp.]
MINDNFALTGALTIAVNEEVVQETHNLVVTAGKNWVADRMADANAVMSHMAIGTGTTAAAAGDTALGTQLDRNALTTSGGVVSGNTITYASTWAAGDGTGAVTEAGIFDASSGGDMLARTVFSVVNKGAADSMTITWTITVS